MNIVKIYDRQFECAISPDVRKSIPRLLVSEEKEVIVEICNIKRQSGYADGGLFAIAAATSLAKN